MGKTFKVGFLGRKFVTEENSRRYHYFTSCSCGKITEHGAGRRMASDMVCDCGNDRFADLTEVNRVVYPYIEVLHKDRKGFKVMRTNLSVFHGENDLKVYVKPNMVQVLIYDFVDKTIKLNKNGKSVINHTHKKGKNMNPYDENVFSRFFFGISDLQFVKWISVAETEPLFEFARRKLGNTSTWGYSRKLWKALVELFDHTYMQILSSAGIPNVQRFYEKTNSYYSNVTINPNGKSPHEILGVPKFIMKHIREDSSINLYTIRDLRKILRKVDGSKIKELLEIAKDESTVKNLLNVADTIFEIHEKYGYNNLKKLTLYILRETKMNQGILSPNTSATLLRDYLKMSKELNMEIDKYPKSLKKEHDMVMMNYKVNKDNAKKEKFIEKVNTDDYSRLEFKDKQYTIIKPKEMEDLIKEGSELSHCIASYIDAVIEDRCQILFLRRLENVDEPLASIEVRNGNIRQARGYANRKINQSEKLFINQWAKEKQLVENYY